MKKITTTILLGILFSASIFANNPSKYSYEDLYHQFSTVEGANALNIGGFLIGLASMFVDDIDYDYIKNIQQLTILDVSSSCETIKTEFRNSINKIDDMELLMEVSDESDNLKIFIKRKNDNISRLLIVETESPCIICIKCDMNTEDLNKFAAELNN